MEATALGDVRVATFIILQERMGRDPARTLADGVIAAVNREPRPAPLPALRTPSATPRPAYPSDDPDLRAMQRVEDRLCDELAHEHAVVHAAVAADDEPEPAAEAVEESDPGPADAAATPAAGPGALPDPPHAAAASQHLAELRAGPRPGGHAPPEEAPSRRAADPSRARALSGFSPPRPDRSHREVLDFHVQPPLQLVRDDAAVTMSRVALEAEEADALPALDDPGQLLSSACAVPVARWSAKIARIRSGWPLRAARRPSAGVPRPRKWR